MIKPTVLYVHPTDILTFENYYMNTPTNHAKANQLTNFDTGGATLLVGSIQ